VKHIAKNANITILTKLHPKAFSLARSPTEDTHLSVIPIQQIDYLLHHQGAEFTFEKSFLHEQTEQ